MSEEILESEQLDNNFIKKSNFLIKHNFDEDPDKTLDLLLDEIDFKQNKVQLTGKYVKYTKKKESEKPRKDAFYTLLKGEIPYYNTGFGEKNIINSNNQKVLKNLILQLGSTLTNVFHKDIKFNSVLTTLLDDGNHFLNWRCETTRNLTSTHILILHFGETRELWIKNKTPENNSTLALGLEKYKLEHGSIFLMTDDFQKTKEYTIPKKANITEPSIQITFFNMKQKQTTSRKWK